ncbi:ustO [Symbiodinium natans]|uniref:UstO protein n=1 Tax=Symbiodinium natans TaxID=878477 RepID=A0A812QSB5_9DINO|nr:ustO [Symbiodinium natans]
MGKTFQSLSEDHVAWLKKQKVFFVASAASKGHVNLSPKGYTAGTFAILSPTQVAYLDFTGSGAETIAHSLQNRRITVMFVAFEGDPIIMRLFGNMHAIQRDAVPADLRSKFGEEFVSSHGFRAVIVIDIHRVQSSCGFSIPFYDYVGERPVLMDHWSKKTLEEVDDYRVLKNSFSIDLLPSIGHRIFNPKAPVVAPRFRAGFWFGFKDITMTEQFNSWLERVLGPLSFLTTRDIGMLGIGALSAVAVAKYCEALRKA